MRQDTSTSMVRNTDVDQFLQSFRRSSSYLMRSITMSMLDMQGRIIGKAVTPVDATEADTRIHIVINGGSSIINY